MTKKKNSRSRMSGSKHQSERNQIITGLADLPTTPDTKDLLHAIFFEFILSRMKDDVADEARLRHIKNIGFVILEMYALAEKASILVRSENQLVR